MVMTVLMAASSASAAVLPQALVSSSSKGRSSSQGYGELCRLASRRRVCVRESFRSWKPLTTCALPSSVSSRDSITSAKKGSPTITPAVLTPSGPADLQTLLLRNRIVFVGSPVNSQVAQRVISQLLTLAAIDENEDIKMYINCPGGSTYSILAIYDTMAWIKPAVSTVCFGIAASQGALLLAGGEKGKRFAMPNARIMIHQPQGGCGGTVDDVRRQVNEVMTSRDKLDKMYSAFTGQPLERVQKFTDRDRFFSAAEAMEFGLIDGLLETEY
jgi:ATP-dependent Clp protease protease subunit